MPIRGLTGAPAGRAFPQAAVGIWLNSTARPATSRRLADGGHNDGIDSRVSGRSG